jgi:outer membrane biosynthesis protein TonB
MRIFNGTKKALTLPYTGGETLTIPAHQPSGNVLCSPEFLSSVITAYNADEIAVIASGPFEISACANIPTAVNYVVQSLDEAIARFNPDAKKIQEEDKKKAAEKKEEPKVEEPKPEVKPEEEKKPEEPKAEEPKKPELKPETVKKAKKEQPKSAEEIDGEKPEEEKKAE